MSQSAPSDFTIADVLAFARTKPADETYDYGSNRDCALCQFLRETGRCSNPSAGGDYWRNADASYAEVPLPDGLERPLQAGTFGALVARLERLCPNTPVPSSEWTRLDAYMNDIETVAA